MTKARSKGYWWWKIPLKITLNNDKLLKNKKTWEALEIAINNTLIQNNKLNKLVSHNKQIHNTSKKVPINDTSTKHVSMILWYIHDNISCVR